MIFQLHDTDISFPDPALAEDDGLLAIGGDLSPERLMLAYQNGIFPWYSEDEPICWYAPHERCVIFPGKIYVSSSMKKMLRSNHFQLTMNTSFEAVIGHCKSITRKEQPGTWITDEMEAAYIELHKQGKAHSVEVWHNETLAGGVYGIVINKVFCGESMFSGMPNASKSALIWLCNTGDYALIDCQLPNDHLLSLGAEMISSRTFLAFLQKSKNS